MTRYIKECTEEIWSAAELRAQKTPVYGNSHRKEEANQVGALGEIIAEIWLDSMGIPFIDQRSTTHDYMLSAINKTLDVKTKDRTVAPADYYECSVPLYNHKHQKPDYYLFISLLRDGRSTSKDIRRFTKAYVLGISDQDLLGREGVVWKAGQTDPSNNTKFWTECINLKISQLTPPSEAKALWNPTRIGG